MLFSVLSFPRIQLFGTWFVWMSSDLLDNVFQVDRRCPRIWFQGLHSHSTSFVSFSFPLCEGTKWVPDPHCTVLSVIIMLPFWVSSLCYYLLVNPMPCKHLSISLCFSVGASVEFHLSSSWTCRRQGYSICKSAITVFPEGIAQTFWSEYVVSHIPVVCTPLIDW